MSATPEVKPSAEFLRARGAYNGRQRLLRIVGTLRRDTLPNELDLIDELLERAAPRHAEGVNRSRFIGMHAVSLTRESLGAAVDDMCLVQHKVDGLGALCAFIAPASSSATEFDVNITTTAFFIRRHGAIDAISPIVLPKRYDGRVLLDGELCLRKKRLSYAEEQRFVNRERHYLEHDNGDPLYDAEYQLCYAAHDCLVADDVAQSTPSGRTRLKPVTATLDYTERVKRLYDLIKARFPRFCCSHLRLKFLMG